MKWTDPAKPIEGTSNYDHVILQTPIGVMMIEWKSWKENPDYSIDLDGVYVDTEYTLEDAKYRAKEHLERIQRELHDFLEGK